MLFSTFVEFSTLDIFYYAFGDIGRGLFTMKFYQIKCWGQINTVPCWISGAMNKE